MIPGEVQFRDDGWGGRRFGEEHKLNGEETGRGGGNEKLSP